MSQTHPQSNPQFPNPSARPAQSPEPEHAQEAVLADAADLPFSQVIKFAQAFGLSLDDLGKNLTRKQPRGVVRSDSPGGSSPVDERVHAENEWHEQEFNAHEKARAAQQHTDSRNAHENASHDQSALAQRIEKLEAALGGYQANTSLDSYRQPKAQAFRELPVRDALERIFLRLGPDFLEPVLPIENTPPLADQLHKLREALAEVENTVRENHHGAYDEASPRRAPQQNPGQRSAPPTPARPQSRNPQPPVPSQARQQQAPVEAQQHTPVQPQGAQQQPAPQAGQPPAPQAQLQPPLQSQPQQQTPGEAQAQQQPAPRPPAQAQQQTNRDESHAGPHPAQAESPQQNRPSQPNNAPQRQRAPKNRPSSMASIYDRLNAENSADENISQSAAQQPANVEARRNIARQPQVHATPAGNAEVPPATEGEDRDVLFHREPSDQESLASTRFSPENAPPIHPVP